MDDVFVPDENELPGVSGLKGSIRLSHPGPLRDLLGIDGCGGVLLARRP